MNKSGRLCRNNTLLSLTLLGGSVLCAGKAMALEVDPSTIKVVRKEAGKLIRRAMDKGLLQGLSLALVNADRVLWMDGFGFADRKQGGVATADTIYRVGSVSKPLTATAIMRLAEQKRLDIDRPFSGALPEFSIRSRFRSPDEGITPRMLMCHHAGLPSNLQKGMWTDTPFYAVTGKLRDEHLAFPPGQVFAYSNIGYDLLGHAIQHLSGMGYARYMRQVLFEPLEMASTGFRLNPEQRERLAVGYLDGAPAEPLPIRDTPAMGLYSSARDLSRFTRMMLAGSPPLLQTGTIREMMREQGGGISRRFGVSTGLGWFIDKHWSGGSIVSHGGNTLLYSAEMVLLPEQGLGIAVLANQSGSRRLVSKIARILLDLVLVQNGIGKAPQATGAEKLKETDSGKTGPESSGRFATDLGLISIDPESGKLCACLIDKVMDLIMFDDGSFGIDPKHAQDLPTQYGLLAELKLKVAELAERTLLLAERNGTDILLGDKLPAAKVDPVWHKRIGKYRLLNPDKGFPMTDTEMTLEDGTLCLHYRMPKLTERMIRIPLYPVSNGQAVVAGLGRNRGETVRVEWIDGREVLCFSGYFLVKER